MKSACVIEFHCHSPKGDHSKCNFYRPSNEWNPLCTYVDFTEQAPICECLEACECTMNNLEKGLKG